MTEYDLKALPFMKYLTEMNKLHPRDEVIMLPGMSRVKELDISTGWPIDHVHADDDWELFQFKHDGSSVLCEDQ